MNIPLHEALEAILNRAVSFTDNPGMLFVFLFIHRRLNIAGHQILLTSSQKINTPKLLIFCRVQ